MGGSSWGPRLRLLLEVPPAAAPGGSPAGLGVGDFPAGLGVGDFPAGLGVGDFPAGLGVGDGAGRPACPGQRTSPAPAGHAGTVPALRLARVCLEVRRGETVLRRGAAGPAEWA